MNRLVAIGGTAALALLLLAGGLVVLARESIRSRIQADRDHLHRLWENYLAASAGHRPGPGSRGYRFWAALVAGEGPYRSGNVISPGAGGRLVVSPNDPVADPMATEALLARVRNGSAEPGEIGPQHVSYAGPRAAVFREPLAGRGETIVGTTATRVYPDGFVFLRANLQTGFIEYAATAGTDDGSRRLPDTVADVGDEQPFDYPRRVHWPYTSGRWYGEAEQAQTQPGR